MKALVTTLLLFCLTYLSSFGQEHGIVPGAGLISGLESGINLRAHIFPSPRVCLGPEINLYPKKGHEVGDGFEASFNGHYLFALSEKVELYPIGGINWKRVDHHESGFRGNIGSGLHLNFGKILPYAEYIYSAGFENESTFLIGTFYSFGH